MDRFRFKMKSVTSNSMSLQLITSFSRSSSNFLHLFTILPQKSLKNSDHFLPPKPIFTQQIARAATLLQSPAMPCRRARLGAVRLRFLYLMLNSLGSSDGTVLSKCLASCLLTYHQLFASCRSQYLIMTLMSEEWFNEIDSPWICCWRKLIMQYRGKGVAQGGKNMIRVCLWEWGLLRQKFDARQSGDTLLEAYI